jgi:phage-related protein
LAEQAYAYVTLIPVAKGFQSKIASEMAGIGGVGGDVGKKFSSGFSGALKGLVGPALAAFSTVAISNFAKGAVDAASSFEAEFEGVNQTFGAAAKSVQEFADNAAYSAGISETAALQAAKNFGGFANAAGLASAQAATFSTDLVQAAGDLASFNDVPVEQALNAISSGLAGSAEPLRQFSIFLDQNTLAAQAAAMGYSGAFSELSQGEQTLVRQAAIMDQMGVSAGDFEAYADTYGNSLKTVQALFSEMQTEIGGALLPALAQLMPAFIPIIETAGPALTKIFEAVVPLIEAIAVNIGPLVKAMSPLIEVFELVVGAGAELIAAIMPPFIELLAALSPIVLAVAEAFMPIIKAILPPLIRLIESLLPFIQMIASFLADFWIPLLGKLVESILPFVVYFIDLFARALEDLNTLLAPVFAALKPIADTLLAIAGIKPGDLNKTITVTTNVGGNPTGGPMSADAAERWAQSQAGAVASSILPPTPGLVTGGAGGPDAAKVIKEAISKAKKAIKSARKEYAKEIKSANEEFSKATAEISEDFSIAVAKAAISRDDSLAEALKDNTSRVAQIQADFAQRLDDIVKQSMQRLRDAYRSAVEINVASIFNSDVVAGSIDGTIETMRQKLIASRQLLANAASLAAAGFSQTFIEQVVGAGTDVGNELAQSILNATPEQQAEMRELFNSIETEASSGMDALSETIYEKNGLANQALKDLYAQTQAELVVALAEQEATYQAQMTEIMARFDQAILDAKTARDEALKAAQETLDKALLAANEKFLEDMKSIKKAFREQIKEMQGLVSGMSAQISALMSQISSAQSAAQAALSAGSSIPKATGKKVKMATGGLVTGPTNALIGEAGPELVIPLDRFESWMSMGAGGSGKAINYYAAPNQSLDSETELFNAMKRAKVVVGW